MALLEERRRRLAAEGLFADERKQLVPYLPRVIGVITSPTGAVIRDILHRLADRFPRHVLVWPVRVQGETSAAEVAAAIAGFNALPEGGRIPRPDVLIVARGGGSLEDLMSFNDEAVVRAAAASEIPLVSAVGHETDWTLIDHAADLRAPTPTAAAEKVVPVRAELIATVDDLARRRRSAMLRFLERQKQALRAAARALPARERLLDGARQRLDFLAAQLPAMLRRNAQGYERRLRSAEIALGRHSPTTRLSLARQRLTGLGERLLLARRRVTEKERERLGRERQRLATLNERLIRALAVNARRERARYDKAAQLFEAVNYKAAFKRGYALVTDAAGTPLTSVKAAMAGTSLTLEFIDGKAQATVDGGSAPRSPQEAAPRDRYSGGLFD